MVKMKHVVESPDFFKKLVDNMQVGVIVSDHEGRIVYINDTYARFLNIDPKEEVGKHATEVVSNTRLHIVAKTGVPEINYPHRFKDTGFLTHRVPILEGKEVIAVLGLVLFDSASTASRLAEKLSLLESKLTVYENELTSLRSTRYTIESIVGVSLDIQRLKKGAIQAAGKTHPILITGESGTGKELFAQAIHHAGPRRPFPFIRINCPAIPKDLLESELFGYEKGAFTGANVTGKPGKFELARHGTVFLDEIGDLPLEMQPKLLRVLEDKEFERVGGTSLVRSDFRLIAATNQKLDEMVERGRFRKDLYYRLNVIPISIPPLRERREDIVPLTRHMLNRMAGDALLPNIWVSKEVEEAFESYAWPGNVRELSNVLERILSSLEGDTIGLRDVPFYLLRRHGSGGGENGAVALRHVQAQAEKEAIRIALEKAGNNKAQAARMLGIHRTHLYRKMHRFELVI